MNEILVFGLGIIALFSVAASAALLRVGVMIDRHPAPEDEERERNLASPIETTRIAVGLYWGLFLLGGYALLQESRNMMIIGITTLFAICTFMITALFFSFSVLGMMRRRKKEGVPAKNGNTPVKGQKTPSILGTLLRRN